MTVALQFVAGDGVEDAGAKEGGANQNVDDIEHGGVPGSATGARHAGKHVASQNS
jgi:hypothetical protein